MKAFFSMYWQIVNAPGQPTARQGHSAVYWNGKMIVFGGQDSSGRLLKVAMKKAKHLSPSRGLLCFYSLFTLPICKFITFQTEPMP